MSKTGSQQILDGRQLVLPPHHGGWTPGIISINWELPRVAPICELLPCTPFPICPASQAELLFYRNYLRQKGNGSASESGTASSYLGRTADHHSDSQLRNPWRRHMLAWHDSSPIRMPFPLSNTKLLPHSSITLIHIPPSQCVLQIWVYCNKAVGTVFAFLAVQPYLAIPGLNTCSLYGNSSIVST